MNAAAEYHDRVFVSNNFAPYSAFYRWGLKYIELRIFKISCDGWLISVGFYTDTVSIIVFYLQLYDTMTIQLIDMN